MAASPEAKFTEETVLWAKHRTPKPMTSVISRLESYRFSAGQFFRLGLRDGEGFIWRAYSVVPVECADTLKYFVVLVEGESMSVRLAVMKKGDAILFDKIVIGFLLPERFPDGKDLVPLYAGSGIAPLLSILEQPEAWRRSDDTSLVHSVSRVDELIFNDRLAVLAEYPLTEEYYCKFRFAPITTCEQTEGVLNGERIPVLLESDELAAKLDMEFNIAATRLMVCGSPVMVRSIFQTLLSMGFTMHRNRLPRQIMMENGF